MVNTITKADRDNAHRICRSCLRKSSKLILLAKSCSQINTMDRGLADCHESIANLMMSCANIQVDVDDGLPQNICRECFINISAAIVYRRKCEDSDKELRRIFHDASLDVSVKEEVRIDSPTEMHDVDEVHWFGFEMVDTETDGEAKKSLDQFDSNPMRFSDCNDSLNEPQIKGSGANQKFMCKTCSKSFNRKHEWQQHQLVHTEERKFGCHICNVEFKSKCNLQRHFRNYHCGDIGTLRDNGETQRNQFDDTPHHSEHPRVHQELSEEPNAIEANAEISWKPAPRRIRRFACDVCDKAFTRVYTLDQHRLVHSDERNYICDICKRRYKTKQDIRCHMRSHSFGKLPYKHLCSECGNRYQGKTALTDHMRQHTGERPFECDVCQKTFHRRAQLTQHKRIHALVKPHQCTNCELRFVTAYKLRIHMMTHTGDRPHKCTMCSASYVENSYLKVHMRTHTGEMPYLCMCGERFQHRSHILKHRRQFNHFEREKLDQKQSNDGEAES